MLGSGKEGARASSLEEVAKPSKQSWTGGREPGARPASPGIRLNCLHQPGQSHRLSDTEQGLERRRQQGPLQEGGCQGGQWAEARAGSGPHFPKGHLSPESPLRSSLALPFSPQASQSLILLPRLRAPGYHHQTQTHLNLYADLFSTSSTACQPRKPPRGWPCSLHLSSEEAEAEQGHQPARGHQPPRGHQPARGH